MSFWTDLVGTKPSVPTLAPIDLGTEQQKAIKNNLAAAPGAAKLSALSQDQIRKMMEQAIPGFDALTGKISANIQDQVAGKIPLDVSRAARTGSASQALAGGFASGRAGSAGSSLEARDLGLTSLDITSKGLASAESWLGDMEKLYSPSEAIFTGMFVTPQQQYQTDVEERGAQFSRNWLENQIKAMPAPWATDLKQFVYRAMSAYSGTAVKDNPYSTPGSFGNGVGGSGGGSGGGPGGNGIAGGWNWSGGSSLNTGQFPGESIGNSSPNAATQAKEFDYSTYGNMTGTPAGL
jgi:hypothetical protein